MCHTPSPPHSYQYCIEMLHGSGRHPERSYKREYGQFSKLRSSCVAIVTPCPPPPPAGSDFADGESWGYRKFYQLSKLVSHLPPTPCVADPTAPPLSPRSRRMASSGTTPWSSGSASGLRPTTRSARTSLRKCSAVPLPLPVLCSSEVPLPC